jgi:hypothetical protein
LAFHTHNSITVDSHQAEGISQVEIDWVGGWNGICDIVQKLENDHNRVYLNTKKQTKGRHVHDHHHYALLHHEEYELAEKLGLLSCSGENFTNDASTPGRVTYVNSESESAILKSLYL